MKKLFKNSFISALLIGILATALWENFISPFCTYIYIHTSSLLETFITTFSNDTYKEISNGFNDSYSLYIIMIIILTFLCIAIIINLLPSVQKYSDKITTKIRTSNDPFKTLHNHLLLLRAGRILSFFFFIISSIYLIGNLIFITDCKTKSLCNLEIISPYVSDNEYKQLKSTFYSIQTKDDYINFTEIINEIGEKYSLNLKE